MPCSELQLYDDEESTTAARHDRNSQEWMTGVMFQWLEGSAAENVYYFMRAGEGEGFQTALASGGALGAKR